MGPLTLKLGSTTLDLLEVIAVDVFQDAMRFGLLDVGCSKQPGSMDPRILLSHQDFDTIDPLLVYGGVVVLLNTARKLEQRPGYTC